MNSPMATTRPGQSEPDLPGFSVIPNLSTGRAYASTLAIGTAAGISAYLLVVEAVAGRGWHNGLGGVHIGPLAMGPYATVGPIARLASAMRVTAAIRRTTWASPSRR